MDDHKVIEFLIRCFQVFRNRGCGGWGSRAAALGGSRGQRDSHAKALR